MNKIIASLTKVKHSGLCADMFLSFIITFTAGVLCFDNYMPEKFIVSYRVVVLTICLLTWLGLSFINGIRKKWQYELFAALFWLIPPLIIFLANDGPEFCRMSIIMYLLSEFSVFISTAPAEMAGGVAGLGAVPSAVIILLLCVFAFLGGNLLSAELTKKKKHSDG